MICFSSYIIRDIDRELETPQLSCRMTVQHLNLHLRISRHGDFLRLISYCVFYDIIMNIYLAYDTVSFTTVLNLFTPGRLHQ
jgi:hypothetical protein